MSLVRYENLMILFLGMRYSAGRMSLMGELLLLLSTSLFAIPILPTPVLIPRYAGIQRGSIS